MRQYKDNFIFRQRWQSWLKKTRAKDMNTLLRNEELTEAFDSLLPIYGIWDGMRLTTIHKIIPMRCPELILNYLEGMKNFYSDLVDGEEDAMQRIDSATVKSIELRAPRASTRDAKFLYSEIHGGRIFSGFSASERERIWGRLQMFEGLVPSLYTFFRDVLYLELLTNSVRRLTQVPKNKSLIEALQKRFTGVKQDDGLIKIQRTEGTFMHGKGNRAGQIDYGIRQLFAFAMREYPFIPREPEKEDLLLQQPRAHADPSVLHCFADLASDLGFASDEITALQRLGTAAKRTYPRSRPILVTSGSGVAPARRCGKPRIQSFKADRNLLFVYHLHDTRQDQGDGITSFFVRKSVYLAFFGRPSGMGNAANMGEHMADPEDPEDPEDTEDADSVLSYYHRQDRDQSQETSGIDQNGGQSQTSTAQEERRQEQELQERLEQERIERVMSDHEKLMQRIRGRQRLGQEIEEQRRQEQLRQEEERRQEQLRQEEELKRRLNEEQLQREHLRQERQAEDEHEQEKVEIRFKVWKRHDWKALPSIYAHPEDSSEVERNAKKYIRRNFRTLDTELQMLAPRDCFQAVIDDRTHTILLVSQHDLLHTDEMAESAKRLHDDALRVLELKRRAEEDISRGHPRRKAR
ncbi:hypothetical protein IFR04_006215 [Cadophora malorum]|uniref:Uncharacterized protein n=1 Tax=Cadophora malorum TaxID=108018 RepID=A0A8H7W821_9HELO|nr:hypothetical protein IFR04_006215 [Cadophora malorum]